MFTGIVEETGRIQTITNRNLVVECVKILEDIKLGDSIAVNGVCLTVTDFNNKQFTADVSPETFRVTTLSELKIGNKVNLERAMPANGRFGGHVVSGHVDGTAKILSLSKKGEFYDLEIELFKDESRYVVKKGSIAVNGISLTIAAINENKIKIAVIPHTFESTSLSDLKVGDYVNIEVDIMAKYVEKFLSTSHNKSSINMEFLERNGFC